MRIGAEAMIETELDVLRDVSRRLESAGISFMLTGSVAMNYYAQPRMTRDIDLVVSLNETQAEPFFRLFETEVSLFIPAFIVSLLSDK